MAAPSKAFVLDTPYKRGSEWRKWDLHVHTPGTGLADNYSGWEDFLKALKNEKEIAVLGVTDYLSIFAYDHIKLNYGLRYNGTELERLSPGTKGIVLLILYLAMDSEDVKPLVVDQPEENLDSESIYSLLSHYFRSAKALRQVIVITHNPNLVVNTDSDQVIVASADRLGGSFPTFSYASGGLENTDIREKVCLILEGGEPAFLTREKRYALQQN